MMFFNYWEESQHGRKVDSITCFVVEGCSMEGIVQQLAKLFTDVLV